MSGEDSIAPEVEGVASRSAEIFFQTARAKMEARKLTARTEFANFTGTKNTAEDYEPLKNALNGLAEACFGRPFSEIEFKLTPEQEKRLLKITKEIQDEMRQRGEDPRTIYGDNIID